MSDSFKQAQGRKVISRATAQEIGAVAHLLVDTERRTVTALIIGKGRKSEMVDWVNVTGFGPDAVMVAEEAALRAPADDREQQATSGGLELIGKRALSDTGTELGTIDDVVFDPATGALELINVASREIPAQSLMGSGSYAAVLRAADIPE